MAERRRILANTQCAVARTSWSALFPCVLNKPQTNPNRPRTASGLPGGVSATMFHQSNPIRGGRQVPALFLGGSAFFPVFSINPKRTQSHTVPPPGSAGGVPAPDPRHICVFPLCFEQTPNEPKSPQNRLRSSRRYPATTFHQSNPIRGGRRIPALFVGMSALFSCLFNKPQTNPISHRTAACLRRGCSGPPPPPPPPPAPFTERTQSRPQPVIIPPKGHSSSCVSRY